MMIPVICTGQCMSCMGSLSVWPTFSFPHFFFRQQSNCKLVCWLNMFKHSVDACKTENQDNFEKCLWYTMPRLNETDRWRAIGMTEAGVRHNDVGVHRNTVDALWRQYQQFGTTRDRPRSGHPRVTFNCQNTYIRFRFISVIDSELLLWLLEVFLVLEALVLEWYVINCVNEAYGHDVQPYVLSPATSSCSTFRLVQTTHTLQATGLGTCSFHGWIQVSSRQQWWLL